MKILVNLGGENSGWLKKARNLGYALKPVLEALVIVDQFYLMTHHVPPLYKSGVRYKNESSRHLICNGRTTEEFASIPAILERGWGDCDDLAPWRVAELRQLGEKAKIRIQWKPLKKRKGRLYHIVVRRADGSIEDPSRLLGMGS